MSNDRTRCGAGDAFWIRHREIFRLNVGEFYPLLFIYFQGSSLSSSCKSIIDSGLNLWAKWWYNLIACPWYKGWHLFPIRPRWCAWNWFLIPSRFDWIIIKMVKCRDCNRCMHIFGHGLTSSEINRIKVISKYYYCATRTQSRRENNNKCNNNGQASW